MRFTKIFFLAAGVLSADAIRLLERGRPAVVGLRIQRKDVENPIVTDRLRRRKSSQIVDITVDNEKTLYAANISLGTPKQNFRLDIDTGSSDLWVNSPVSGICRSRGSPCAETGTYIANDSSTYKYVSSDFNISYVDGTGAIGDYVTDTISVGGVEMADLQFGVGYNSTSRVSVLGIGYITNEARVTRSGKAPYANLPELMVENELIQSNLYSLWLNDLQASTGEILFGGVNTAKYIGNLSTLPIARFSGESTPSEFIITLSGLSLSNGKGPNQLLARGTIPVLLDSGSTLSYLPDQIALDIFNKFGAYYDVSSEVALVPCSLAGNTSTLDFTFSGPKISVPMNELVIDLGKNTDGSTLTLADGSPACIFGISKSGHSMNVLGDTFLRSAYVVYDLENHQISLAQTNFNSTTDNIKEISGGRGVPGITGRKRPCDE